MSTNLHTAESIEEEPTIEEIDIKSITEKNVEIQLKISQPEAVSSVLNEPCYLVVSMHENLFLDVETNSPLETDLDLVIEAPRMLDRSDAEFMYETAENICDSSAYVSSLDIFVSLALGFSLKLIWSILNTL